MEKRTQWSYKGREEGKHSSVKLTFKLCKRDQDRYFALNTDKQKTRPLNHQLSCLPMSLVDRSLSQRC